jgi:hypothetical protein
MRVNCDCNAMLRSMTEEEKAAVPPHYDPRSGMLQETFNIDGDHFWVETWGVMEARQLLLEMHGPTSTMKDPNSKRYYVCQHCGFKGQKHGLNLHRNHGLCRAEAVKGVRLKSYPTIPWADTISSMRSLSRCNTVEDVLQMFRDVKLRGSKRGTGVASTADSLANFERTERAPKRVAESEAQSRPPKKTGANPTTRKRELWPSKEQPLREILPVSSSDSFSGSYGRSGGPAGTPMTEDDFEDEDIDKLAKGRSKRKKVGHVDLARAREIVKQSEEAFQLLKEREEAAEKAAREAQ